MSDTSGTLQLLRQPQDNARGTPRGETPHLGCPRLVQLSVDGCYLKGRAACRSAAGHLVCRHTAGLR